MRILLIGEYSHLHNSLKQGLVFLGHEVSLVSSGDGFKNLPSDFSYDSKICKNKFVHIFKQIIYRISDFDIAEIERGLRFFAISKIFQNYDIVQLINEKPIQTTSNFELYLLKKIFKKNQKVYVLASGVDYLNVQYLIKNKSFKSILNPYFENKNLAKYYEYVFKYSTKNHKKLHGYVYENCQGFIASDLDYHFPLLNVKKYLGLIANPINIEKLEFETPKIDDKIIIFLGVNTGNYYQKGINYFEKALAIIKEKYHEKVEIIIAKNIPYKDYINLYNKSHILLDQIFANDQGYNALEAMAKGKVVFTGAGIEFQNFYNLKEKVAIEANPDVDYLVKKLSFLIENPEQIEIIAKNARLFVVKEHNFIEIAQKYIDKWTA